MGVAEVSGTGETGQSTDRDAEQRVGLGLLSRFIGAVFLVLLGGLLLLDQALVRANRNQAALDAQSAVLLTESFVDAHDVLLDRLIGLATDRRTARDSALLHDEAARLLVGLPSIRRAWVSAPNGRRVLDVSRDEWGRS